MALGSAVIRILNTLIACAVLCVSNSVIAYEPSGKLEIHYINVGQGGSTLIIGPDGTRLIYDFGNVGRGKAIVKYLTDHVGLQPDDGIHFTFVSHRDVDHYGGFVDLIKAGFDVQIANFDSGSDKFPTTRMKDVWITPASKTMAGKILPVPVGLRIPLGDGAEVRVIAANGKIFGYNTELPFARNENDRSIALYVKYKDFDYILDGDLGAGRDNCTDRDTTQRNFQLPIAEALISLTWMDAAQGVDVLHISHHGSESSTSSAYFDAMKPEVGLISVGLNQRKFRHPRVDVVEGVLIGENRKSCVKAKSLMALFQTEQGKIGDSATGSTSFLGMPIGSIKLTTDGVTAYQISGSGDTGDGVACRPPSNGVWSFPLDELGTVSATASVNEQCLEDRSTCECDLDVR